MRLEIEVKTNKTITVNLTIQQIKNYMRIKGWNFDSNTIRSPGDGRIGLSCCLGEQLLLNCLADFEKRESHDVAMSILNMDRNR